MSSLTIDPTDKPRGPSAYAAAEIDLHECVDLDEFPIHEIGNPKRQALIDHAREGLEAFGCAHVPNFLTAKAIKTMRDEATRIMDKALPADANINPYLTADDEALPKDHPKRIFSRRTSSFINSDELEAGSLLRKIYDSDIMVHFICECLNVGPIYRWADPLGRNPYSVMKDGDYFPWHFDGNDFTVSLLVQEAEDGGDFEYCPNIRTAANENFDDVKAALKGERTKVKVLKLKEGDLQIFRGRNSLHRVTPTSGGKPRIIALPTYVTDPYHVNRPHHAKAFYGRAMPIHVERERTRLDGLTD